MYYYILDPTNIATEKFERYQIELQGLLAEFNVSGETARVTPLRSITDLVDIASNRGVKTIVACGNDDTFNLMLASLRGRDFVLGFIPLDENSYLGKILGVNSIASAVKTIAGRRIERIDLANVGPAYFISYLELGLSLNEIKKAGFFSGLRMLGSSTTNITIRIDDSYNLEIDTLSTLIVNTRSTSSKDASVANPTDGYLDILILEKCKTSDLLRYKSLIIEGLFEQVPNSSVIRCKQVECLEPKGTPIRLAGKVITKFPATIHIAQERLRMIVGKTRTF